MQLVLITAFGILQVWNAVKKAYILVATYFFFNHYFGKSAAYMSHAPMIAKRSIRFS